MKKINDGHYLELMDRLYVKLSEIEEHLMKHPLTPKIKKVKKLIDKAGMSLAEAYQIIGELNFKKNESSNAIHKVVLRRCKKPKK